MENKKEEYELLTVHGTPELKIRYRHADFSPKGSILFVHGICHGAWCWKHFMGYFSKNGYECFALNLRGHGDNDRSDLKGARLSDYADDVKRCVDYCTAYCAKQGLLEKPFLLGHSMGGAVVQKYIGRYSDKVKGAVLFASATAPKMPWLKTILSLRKKNLRTAAQISWGIAKTDEEVAQSAFFDNKITSEEEIHQYHELLHKEAWRITFISLYLPYTKNHEVTIPVFVIGSDEDSYFPKKSLGKTADVYTCKENDKRKRLKILEGLCHDMMLDPKRERAAEAVLEFLEQNK